MTNYWVVHLRPKSGEYDYATASRGLIAIYWGEMGALDDVSRMQDEVEVEETLAERLRESSPDESAETLRNWQTSLRYFVWEMEVGDLVVSPTMDGRCFLGVVTSGYLYDGDQHVRMVQWRPVPRNVFSEELKASISAPPTVYRVDGHCEELSRVFLEHCQPYL